MYLNQGYVSFFTIHLGYNNDTMYLNPQIHGTQDTLTIHVGFFEIHRDTFKDTYLEPYLLLYLLRPRLDARWDGAWGGLFAAFLALLGA